MNDNLVMSDYAIEELVSGAIKDFKEIEGIGSDFAKDLLEIFDGDEAKRGIKIKIDKENLTVDILLRVYFLTNLIELSKKLRKKINEVLSKFTPYKNFEINFFYIDVKDKNED
ncbi:MAG TPA: Asp23/Gls24 family envelope stress response protein [Caldisericia bacterium]|nr:Asp23/Gls24 family envelope stress response protein [Caldisericia bacterium]HOL83284.1 Asp23/Gls24 family envelope stress response protein [Caldisericia bacterium]HPC57084.1 Asp23/Gls24 family envelope stress response protein [Caldisericia bacterium]HPP43870.1 Asp23/Gls24 family envelope stress response protein [Caldisericia bacterium]HRT37456.1 Asp23/Gls24 family envelope stress response protein [Caldisericia bacterium]